MRKALLLAALAVMATMTVNAQTAQKSAQSLTPEVDKWIPVLPDVEETRDMATPGNRPSRVQLKASPDTGDPRAFYKRPAGAFYGTMITTVNTVTPVSSNYSPYVLGWPYRAATWEQNCLNIGENPSYDWTYQTYDRTTKTYPWQVASGDKITVDYKAENDTVPSLFAQGSKGEAYHFLSAYTTKTEGTTKVLDKQYTSKYLARRNYQTAYSNTGDKDLWNTVKFRGYATARDGSIIGGGTYVTVSGAEGNRKYWYGVNDKGIDGLAVAFEKPEHPYLLKRIGVYMQLISFVTNAQPFDLYVDVYKQESLPAYNDTASVTIVPGERIARGVYHMDPSTLTATSGIFPFDLLDPYEEELEVMVTPEINDAILVVFSGYNNSGFDAMTLSQSMDTWDEGFGEQSYLMMLNDDKETYTFRGINNFFTSGYRKTALTIFADIDRPEFVWNYLSETGEYQFPDEGETHSVEIYTASAAEDFEFTLADGSELPNWLKVEAVDKTTEEEPEFSGLTNMVATAEALPEGVKYREAIVKLHIPGAILHYKFTQGEYVPEPEVKGDVNGDGVVDIADVNCAINVILGSETAEKYEGRADVNGDGAVDIADVNEIINIILGTY